MGHTGVATFNGVPDLPPLGSKYADHDPWEMYKVDLLVGDREKDNKNANVDITMLESFIRIAEDMRTALFDKGWVDYAVVQTSAAVFQSDNSQTSTRVKQAVLSNTRIFGTAMVNEARFGWNNFNNDVVRYYAFKRDVAAELKMPGLNAIDPSAYGVPSVSVGNGISGFGGGDPWVTRNHTFQYLDNVSVVAERTR